MNLPSEVIVLNRKQLGMLSQIYYHFKEVEWFSIEVDHSSGIGAGVVVKFKLFGDDDTKDTDTSIDITDLHGW